MLQSTEQEGAGPWTLSDSPDAVDGLDVEIVSSTAKEAAFETIQETSDNGIEHFEARRLTGNQVYKAALKGSFEDILREADCKRRLYSGVADGDGFLALGMSSMTARPWQSYEQSRDCEMCI